MAKAVSLFLLIEPFWTGGAAAFVLLALYSLVDLPAWYGLVAGAFPFLIRWAGQGYPSRRTPFDLPLVLLLLAGLLGIYFSSNRSLSLGVYESLLALAMLYYSLANYEHLELLLKLALPSGAIAALLIGGFIFLERPRKLFFPFRQIQSLLHPQMLPCPEDWVSPPLAPDCGITIVIEVITLILVGLAIFPGKKSLRAGYGILSLLLLWLLTISYCRATWPIMAGGLIFLLLWRSRRLLLSLPAWLGLACWGITARIGYTLPQAWQALIEGGGRLHHGWPSVLHAIAQHPLTGCGLGGYTLPYSHNSYLQFYCDFGLAGAIALVLAAIVFLRIGWRLRSISGENPWLGPMAGVWSAMLLAAVYSLVESAPACILVVKHGGYYYTLSPLFPLLAGTLAAIYQRLLARQTTSGPG